MTILGAVILFAVVATVGILSERFMGADNPVEEVAEAIIEEEIEETIGLPEDSLDGKIDLSPNTKENK